MTLLLCTPFGGGGEMPGRVEAGRRRPDRVLTPDRTRRSRSDLRCFRSSESKNEIKIRLLRHTGQRPLITASGISLRHNIDTLEQLSDQPARRYSSHTPASIRKPIKNLYAMFRQTLRPAFRSIPRQSRQYSSSSTSAFSARTAALIAVSGGVAVLAYAQAPSQRLHADTRDKLPSILREKDVSKSVLDQPSLKEPIHKRGGE